MPLRIPDKLPAIDILKKENIFVMDSSRAHTQDIRPLHIVILNLMPLKITTETDLIRLLSNTPLQMDITFMKLKSHTPKNTPIEHMLAFYKDFDVLKDKKFDGMIITGAPVENYAFEEVTYWEEVTKFCMGTQSCHQHIIYMLGCTGRALLSLWHTQISTAKEDVRCVQATHTHAAFAHIQRLRRLFLHATEQTHRDTQTRY